MKMIQDRAVLTVSQKNGSWMVELEGEIFGVSPEKAVARAAANRRARDIMDGGRPCLVQVSGETGFFNGVS
jgi:hypothetical protein